MPDYCYVYVLRSLADNQFYVGLTRDLRARLQSHNKGLIASTKRRIPFELVYWEGCLNDSDAVQREKYLKTAWRKRYFFFNDTATTEIYTLSLHDALPI